MNKNYLVDNFGQCAYSHWIAMQVSISLKIVIVVVSGKDVCMCVCACIKFQMIAEITQMNPYYQNRTYNSAR